MEQSVANPNFLKSIEEVQSKLIEMSGAVLRAHEIALEGFISYEADIFDKVATALKEIESTANEVDNKIVKTLALHGAGAIYIRFLIAGMKITNILANSALDIKKYAKNTKELIDSDSIDLSAYRDYIINLHKCAINSIAYSLDSIKCCFSEGGDDDFVLAKIEESKTDDLHSLLEKEILSLMYKEGDKTETYIRVLKNIKKIERSADRAVDVCSLVQYCKEGGNIKSY